MCEYSLLQGGQQLQNEREQIGTPKLFLDGTMSESDAQMPVPKYNDQLESLPFGANANATTYARQ